MRFHPLQKISIRICRPSWGGFIILFVSDIDGWLNPPLQIWPIINNYCSGKNTVITSPFWGRCRITNFPPAARNKFLVTLKFKLKLPVSGCTINKGPIERKGPFALAAQADPPLSSGRCSDSNCNFN
jgi:hypothetical protein